MAKNGRRLPDDPDRRRSAIDNTDAGLATLMAISKVRILGETTFRNPSYTVPIRIVSVVFYPLAVIGAIVQPIIWLGLVTAFSPAARLTPYLSFLLEWLIFLSLLFGLIPQTAVQFLPDFLVSYHKFMSGTVNWILSLVALP